MKKTIDINLGGSAFVIDEDAYRMLKNYLDDIASRLPEDDAEVISDIEARLAEILQTRISIRSQVVDQNMIKDTMDIMGRPEEFGEKTHINEMKETMRAEQGPRKLYRNMADRWLGGVCSGVAAYFKIDTSLVRIITFLLIFFGGLSLWVYIILWIVLPKAYLNLDGTVNRFDD